MDLQVILSSIKTLNDYIAATEQVVRNFQNLEIQLNISTVLSLKKVRSLEIEYFSKCDDHGVAFAILDRLLKEPPSKKWILLGKALTPTILYWLDAVRRHLISHSQNWWTILQTLLRFIKELKSKDPSLPGVMVQQTMECLLDLACNQRLNETQRHEILNTVNECSAESTRELRNEMKDQLSGYFIKLSKILPNCGHFPTQLSILESLLRWLVGRYDPQVRRAAALAWFPDPLYQRAAVELFLERNWADFNQNAREFLILQNGNRSDLITSALCKKFVFGSFSLIQGSQSQQTWLDINAATRSITFTLDISVLERSTSTENRSFETLVLNEENVSSVQLFRSPSETKLTVHTLEPVPVQAVAGAARDFTAIISSRQLVAVDRALRSVFLGKYRVLMKVNETLTSPENTPRMPSTSTRNVKSSDEGQRSSIPLRKRRQFGVAVRPRHLLQLNSPSTTSTTSLAQLHEKLAALPPIHFTKESIKIAVQPELPVVREVSEGDELSFSQSSSSKPKRFGVCTARRVNNNDVITHTQPKGGPPVTHKKDKPVSSMLNATLSFTDESFINDTFDKLTANNAEYDLVDLLAKEALQNGPEKDSGITVDKKTQESEVIENTPAVKQIRHKKLAKKSNNTKCTVVSTTTDESNTEPVNEIIETPCFVTDRKKRVKSQNNTNAIAEECFDSAAVDTFFSQHYSENAARIPIISPGLAKILNQTSSEVSDQNVVDKELVLEDLSFEPDVVDCLNNMVDEVCSNLEKHAKMLNKEPRDFDISKIPKNQIQNVNSSENDEARIVTLKYQRSKKRVPKKNTKQKNSARYKKTDKTFHDEEDVFIENTITNSPVNKLNTSLVRKKRKLYSPKDAENNMDESPRAKVESRQSMETPIATSYKELEKARKIRSRIPRKYTKSSTEESPKTKKLNDMFDKLKEKVDNDENITLVKKRKPNRNDMYIYNFTSDSEDEDFEKKKIEVKKRVSRTSPESTATKRRTIANQHYSEGNDKSSGDETKTNTKKRKVVKKTKPKSRKVIVEQSVDLTDERMRGAPTEVLETSFIKETTEEKVVLDPEPSITRAPEVEIIPDNETATVLTVLESSTQRTTKAEIGQLKQNLKKKVKKNTEILAIKKEKDNNKKEIVENYKKSKDSGSESSLPGLVVESEQPRKDVISSSIEANLLQKFKNICSDGLHIDGRDTTQNLILAGNNTLKEISSEAMEVLESPEERSIETGGKSPITGHNDFDEPPPNMELLQERFEDRDLEIQDMNQSMADFYVQLRSALLPHGPSTNFTDKVAKMSSEVHGTTPKSSIGSPKVVLRKTQKTASTKSSASVVLERLSSDEINKWLPMPSKGRDVSKGNANRQNTRSTTKNPKRINKKTPEKKPTVQKIKSVISPLRLSFDLTDNMVSSKSSAKENADLENFKSTRLQTKRLKTLNSEQTNKDVQSDVEIVEQFTQPESSGKSVKPLSVKSAITVKDGKMDGLQESNEPTARSIASVTDWFKKNMASIQTSSSKDKSIHAMKDLLEKVIETLEITFTEMDQSTSQKLALMFMDNQEKLSNLQKELRATDERLSAEVISEVKKMFEEFLKRLIAKFAERAERFQEKIAEFEKEQKESACEVLRTDRKQKIQMLELLREDLLAALHFINQSE